MYKEALKTNQEGSDETAESYKRTLDSLSAELLGEF